MFPNYQQGAQGAAQQPDAANALGQQRPGVSNQAPQHTPIPGSSTSHQMLQQALQQNPHLAAQLQQRLQPGNVQVTVPQSIGYAHMSAVPSCLELTTCETVASGFCRCQVLVSSQPQQHPACNNSSSSCFSDNNRQLRQVLLRWAAFIRGHLPSRLLL